MSAEIVSSVGKGGVNRKEDVALVQKLLNAKGYKVGIADGICGKRTLFAIETFQQTFLKQPDGRIDPGGLTWKRLVAPGAPTKTPPTLTKLIAKPAPGIFNVGLSAVNNALMTKLLGNPREKYSEDCQPMENVKLKRHVTTASIGPFRVTGLKPAVEGLQQVMADIRKQWPDAYNALGTAGMLCCRFQRGSTKSISNHSWGTAIDLTLNGLLDKRGDNLVQNGLTLIAPVFNKHGWYWGATFPTEDAMHFEASKALIEKWSNLIT